MACVDHGFIYSLIKALFNDLSQNGTIWQRSAKHDYSVKTVKKLRTRGQGQSPICCAAPDTVALWIVVAREFFKKLSLPIFLWIINASRPSQCRPGAWAVSKSVFSPAV